jgi:hypothetical protein
METVAVAPSAPQTRSTFRFTPENAREWGRKGQEARKRTLALRKAKQEAIEKALDANLAKPPLPSPPPTRDTFADKMLARTRARLDALFTLLEKASTSRSIESLSKSVATLARLEQVLARRPSPGSLRPVSPTELSERRARLREWHHPRIRGRGHPTLAP